VPRAAGAVVVVVCPWFWRIACSVVQVHRKEMAGALGLEPRTSGFGDRRSSQLSYAPVVPPMSWRIGNLEIRVSASLTASRFAGG
jgi:hypothetical protein